MSHSKEEEEVEDLQCILDHFNLFDINLNKIKDALNSSKTPSKEQLESMLKDSKKELKGILKRLNYMLKDLAGEL